ncbi:DUF6019 family protein [Enterococcus sp. LJL51]|uniref:DUF6019 family protein n=1 Tax=Enterococcus sp. LJL51 TaxID=3416656 RepID=UPI003CEEA753
MQSIGISFGSIILLAIVFYFVIKYAVRKAIIEATVYQQELSESVYTDKVLNELALLSSGPYGLGTELFNNLSREQKDILKPEYKLLTKRFNKLYLSYPYESTKNDFQETVLTLKKDFDLLVDKVRAFEKKNAADESL